MDPKPLEPIASEVPDVELLPLVEPADDEGEVLEEKREVEARSAADMLLLELLLAELLLELELELLVDVTEEDEDAEPDDPAFDDTDADGLLEPPPPPPLRPKPERLPRNRGATSEAEFSAPVEPVSRIVASTVPNSTGAVRIAATAACVLTDDACRAICQ